MLNSTTSRPWEWSPSPTSNAFVSFLLHTPLLAEAITKYPNQATFYGVRLVDGNKPNTDDVRRIASKIVAVQVTLVD
jgi:hypothetical protein